MPWDYDPKDAADCLSEGEYDAELAKVEETTSKAGNPMLLVTWNVFTADRTWPVRDYIVQPSGLYKLKGIARAWGMLADFNGGTFDLEAQVGKMARLYLTVQSQDGYPDKNQISGVKAGSIDRPPERAERPTSQGTGAPSGTTHDSGIPF